MKKKNKLILILTFLIFALIISKIPFARADSGWDGSYDSGGWSTGSDWSSDWGSDNGWGWGTDWSDTGHHSSWNYSNNNYDYDPSIGITLVILFIIFIFIIIMKTKIKDNNFSKNYSPLPNTTTTNTPIDLIGRIKSILPEFEENIFANRAFKIYKDVQIAWMDFDYETLRKITTDELYNLYHSQLVALNLKKQKNIMKDFKMNSAKVIDMEHNSTSISIKIRMQVECLDYVINKDEKVVRGTDNNKMIYTYEMTFIKGLDDKNNKCPNCNAPLENVQSSVCPYCDSTIINNNHDWILSKKQMILQSTKRY